MRRVPEYDAFGREIGEDTLAGLGGTDATVRPTPAPTAEPTPEPAVGGSETPPPEAPMQRITVRRSRGLGCIVGLLILVAVIAGPAIAIFSLVDEAGDAFDDVTGAIDSLPEAPDVPEAPAPAPVGIEGQSMIAKRNLAGTLAQLRADGVKSVVRLTVRPNRIETEAIKGRRERDVQFTFDGAVHRGDASRVNPALGSIPLADVDAAAAARLVRNSAKRFRVRERGINYLVASSDTFTGTGHRWVAYFKNQIYVEGDERGRVIRRIDSP
jgi:hypothetical protein